MLLRKWGRTPFFEQHFLEAEIRPYSRKKTCRRGPGAGKRLGDTPGKTL
jgi:hypothetical protein